MLSQLSCKISDKWKNELLRCTVHEVGDSRTAVSSDSWDLVVQGSNECWKYILSISLLEVFSHVIADLTDAVEGSVSDSWIRVLQMLEHLWNHGANILDVINVLTNLREGHKGGILVSPD